MTVNEAGKMGAERRRLLEREPILAKARLMNQLMGRKPDPRLNPPLQLTKGDML